MLLLNLQALWRWWAMIRECWSCGIWRKASASSRSRDTKVSGEEAVWVKLSQSSPPFFLSAGAIECLCVRADARQVLTAGVDGCFTLWQVAA